MLHDKLRGRLSLYPDKPDDRAAQYRSQIIPGPANNHHHPDDKGKAQRVIGRRGKLAIQSGQHRACHTDHSRSNDKGLTMAEYHILAHGSGGMFIIANGAHHPSPGRTRRPVGKEQQNT